MGHPIPKHSPGFDEDDPARRRRVPDDDREAVIDPTRHPDQDPAIDRPIDGVDDPPGEPRTGDDQGPD
ncbi:MAG: hypothetical protein J0H01_27655 [Rhizobiales bacterium]|nr:hypothetical protein [Hyphomicrobiales bacterium]